jgi:hypothetical protein
MNIWLRKPGTTDFLGPFTREAALTQLAAGTITTDYEVLEATGQTFGALKRSTDWSPVSSAFSAEEISSIRASSLDSKEPNTGSEEKPEERQTSSSEGLFSMVFLVC